MVQTNHNIDTQYTASEMQTRQENKIKIRGLDNTTGSKSRYGKKSGRRNERYFYLARRIGMSICSHWCMGIIHLKKCLVFIAGQIEHLNNYHNIIFMK